GDQAFPLDLSAWSFDAAGNPDVRQPLGGAEMGLNADTVTTDQVDKAAQEITVTSESQGEEDYEAGKGPGVADSVSVFLPDAKRGMPPF
ncbi:MAG: hypothetical protein J2P37_24245, partial [Ktedonobacteraceae bacterium]|nr:hypothetical protein [Ktedonobacteraceae bacterium]